MKRLYVYDDECGKRIYFKDKKTANRFISTMAEEMEGGGDKKQIKQDIAECIYAVLFWE